MTILLYMSLIMTVISTGLSLSHTHTHSHTHITVGSGGWGDGLPGFVGVLATSHHRPVTFGYQPKGRGGVGRE